MALDDPLEHDDAKGGDDGKPKGDKSSALGNPNTPAGKKKDHKESILVAVSIIGVVIAWISFKSISSGASNSTVSGTSAPLVSSGTVAGASSDTADSNSYLNQLSTEVGAMLTSNQANATAQQQANSGFASYLSNLSDEIGTLSSAVTAGAGTPSTPTATPSAFAMGSAAQNDTYVRNASDNKIFQVSQSGAFYWLNPAEYASLGKPAATNYSGADPTNYTSAATPPPAPATAAA